MREFKFRVWDTQLKRMDHFDLKGAVFHLPNDVERVMQGTGVIDVEGGEIYEGDLIGTVYPCDFSALGYGRFKLERAEVFWNEFAFGFQVRPDFGPGCICEPMPLNWFVPDIYISGNVYENKTS